MTFRLSENTSTDDSVVDVANPASYGIFVFSIGIDTLWMEIKGNAPWCSNEKGTICKSYIDI
jgi:hypothetical protein